MQGNNHFFPYTIHRKDLVPIKGVNFTSREIDVISCLISVRGTRKVSSLLSISPNTVLSHIHNIMLKVGSNSREGIIDFVEQSRTLPLVKEHYAHLVKNAAFKKCLKDISKVEGKTKQRHLVIYEDNSVDRNLLEQHLSAHLNQAGINVEIKNDKTILNNKGCEIKSKNKLCIFILEKKEREKFLREPHDLDDMNMSEYPNYYFLIFEILKKFLYPINLIHHTQNFIEKYENMGGSVHRNSSLRSNNIVMKNENEYEYEYEYEYYVLGIFCILLTYVMFQILNENRAWEELMTRSDLSPPMQMVLFNRPGYKSEINKKLKEARTLKTVIHVKLKNSGQMILNYPRARQQAVKVIWERNGENHIDVVEILLSFEELYKNLGEQIERESSVKEIQNSK